jgi:hypothetical protein
MTSTWPAANPIAQELDDFWRETQSLVQQFWVEADIDTRMTAGDQQAANYMWSNNFYRQQQQLQFNKILRVRNMISGFQRDHRLASTLEAADNDPDMGETAQQRTTALSWAKRQDGTYEKISDCFEGGITSGLELMSIWLDPREDPENPAIRTTRLPYSSFVMDNYWTQQDLSDCTRIWTRKYVNRRQLLALFPDLKKDLPYLGKGYVSKDGKFQFMPENWTQYNIEMYAYDEYWVRDWRKVRKILDKFTGEVVEWKGNAEQFKMLARYNPNLELITAQKPSVKLHVLVNNNHMYEEKRPYGLDKFPFVPFMCYHFPEVQNYAYRYMGIPRNIRSSQIELNRRRNRQLDILDAQIQSGLMVKEDALVNPEDAFFQGPGKILYFKQNANLATDVVPINPPMVAPGWEELIANIEKEIMDIVGPEELFGNDIKSKEMTSILMKIKMGQGLTGLRGVFDKLNVSQMAVSTIMDDLIVNNWSEGHVARIIGKKPTDRFFDTLFSKFNCVVDEGELTSTQRQFQFLQALQIKQMGVPISNRYIVERSNLQDKKTIIEEMDKMQQQQGQMQQMQMQSEMQKMQAEAQMQTARAENEMASAYEKKTRAVADMSLAKWHEGKAIHDMASGALDNARALKEVESMQTNHLHGLIHSVLDMQLKQKELMQEDEVKSESAAKRVGGS